MNTIETNSRSQLSVLFLSFDGYSDIWHITFDHFFKYWQDCPYKIYLLTNHEIYLDSRVVSLQIGDDISWSDNLSKALEKIDTPYIFTLFDDFILKSFVSQAEIEKYVQVFIENKYDYLRLQPVPPPNEKMSAEIGRITEGALYRLSLCLSIIKKSTLQSLLVPHENAWTFEFKGSERSDDFHHFYSTYNYSIPYYNAIEKGKWHKEVLAIVEHYGIDANSRGIHEEEKLSNKIEWLHFSKKKLLFECIPPKFQRSFLRLYQKYLK